jgi:hypothetical protein
MGGKRSEEKCVIIDHALKLSQQLCLGPALVMQLNQLLSSMPARRDAPCHCKS